MRKAEKILSTLSQRGQRGLPLERVYRLLFQPQLYQQAYAKIAANTGALTAGVDQQTADGMSLAKIDQLIDDIRHERFRWRPVRRCYIPKRNGKLRPLGLPSWRDKLLQGVLQLILEAYYEPQFSNHSHGFRPQRGCHTALQQIKMGWHGVSWFIEGDIAGCFDNIDHQMLLTILARRIRDNRFLRLVEHLLKAGYLEDWKYHQTHSGTPQGGVVSPILANIYLNELDTYVAEQLIPAYTAGTTRIHNREYHRVKARIKRLHQQGAHQQALQARQHLRTLPKCDPYDANFRRLWYVRYADDFILGYIGPRQEAEVIKSKVKEFLEDKLRLSLSQQKTLITHAASQRANFLGYQIGKMHSNTKLTRIGFGPQKGKKRRSVNGVIALYVPGKVIENRCQRFIKRGKACSRGLLVHESDFSILAKYQNELRGLVQYYLLAQNVSSLYKVKYVMETSLLKTLAQKHRSTVSQMAKKYKTVFAGYVCFEVLVPREGKKPLTARFGGFAIRHQRRVVSIEDVAYQPTRHFKERNELLKRLLANHCEICGSTQNCEVHHIRKMADLQYRDGRPKQDVWTRRMAEMQRKTLIVCRHCHDLIHGGKLAQNRKVPC